MTAEVMKERTKNFALRVIRLCRTLSPSQEGKIIGRQLLRSATSVGANYRAVCRARSRADFVSKLGVVLEEADESLFWLELVVDAKLARAGAVQLLRQEASELVAILTASLCTAKTTNQNLKSKI
jgi:four helix bundle protein